MNAVSTNEALVGALAAAEPGSALRPSISAGLRLWPLVLILTMFWVYVALSNVLYAHSMQVSFSVMSPGKFFFAAWDARILQHLILYPFLLGCVLCSLRVGWQPGWRAIPIQLLLALFFAVLASPALMLGETLTGHEENWSHGGHTLAQFFSGFELAMWLASATNFLLTYGFGLALISGFALYQRMRDSQLRSAALERALASAHLAALRMQLSPHTLFNLLHTIRGQIGWDPAAAQAMVVQLGDLLRRLLTAGERDFSLLQDELRFARLYLELQQKRFADRLTIWMADIEELPPLWVPSLILQPLIENAVVHGLAGHAGPVEIRVEATVCGEHLWLRVINTIPRDSLPGRDGIGLRNVRERLMVQFGAAATFNAAAADAATWIAEICMPLLRDGPGAG